MSPSRVSLAAFCCLSGAVSLSFVALPVHSSSVLSDQGYTGYTNAPSAYVTPEGRLQFMWSDALSGAQTRPFQNYTQADNYFVSFGMFPRLELGMRLINTGEDQFSAGLDTRFSDVQGQRDLSTNIKALLFRSDVWPSFAIGRQDASGNGLFSATYGVASYRWRMLEASLGYGNGRFDGAFYGVSAQLGRYGRVLYDDDNTQRVLAIEAHSADLIPGLRMMGRYRAVASGRQAETGFSVGVEADLGQARRWSSTRVTAQSQAAVAERRVRLSRLDGLTEQAADCDAVVTREATRSGLERVRLSSHDSDGQKHLLMAAEGIRFTHSPVDAAGVALGLLVAGCANGEYETVTVQLTEHGAPRFWVSAKVAEARQYFVAPDAVAPALAFGLGAHEDFGGVGPRNGIWADVQLAPRLRYTVATEVGVLDYSVGVETVVTAPLWRGASILIEGVDDVAATSDFRPGPGGALQNLALRDGLVSQGLQQVVPLGRWGAMRGFIGRSKALDRDSDLTVAEAFIQPFNDIGLQFETRYSDYDFRGPRLVSNGQVPPTHQSAWLGTTRYFSASSGTLLELTWGRYHFGDEGARVRLERFFADTSVFVSYLRDKDKEEEGLAVGVSVPFGGRRSVVMGPVAVGGSADWETSLLTKINASRNFLRPNLLREVVPPGGLHDRFYDRGRLSRAYLQSQWPRMRHAFETFVPAF